MVLAVGQSALRECLAKSQEPKAKSGVALHSYMLRRLLKQLAAVLIGNAIYFLLLMPHLPPAAQHQPDRLDLGLLVDFWICVVVYGIIELIARRPIGM